MAFLLGNESCIESLRCDLNDVQETINDILSRGGNVRCYSWKFPDKMATDININELLEMYQFSQDKTHNQITHYSLLELIIDRLVLLVHLSNTQIEKCLNFNDKDSTNSKPPSAHGLSNNLSTGIAVKKYWSKFTHLCSTLRHYQNKALKQKEEAANVTATIQQNGSGEKPPSMSNTRKLSKAQSISDEASNKNTQTIETAFVPCESCSKVQSNLKQNADSLLNILHFQNIPSSLAKFRSSFPSIQSIGWLNGNDMQQWLNEQDKDINKLAKHVEFLNKNNEILKIKINEFEVNLSKLTESEKEFKKQIKEEEDVRATLMKQYEKKLSDQKAELNVQLTNKDNQLKTLNKTKENLDSQITSLNEIKKENEHVINTLNESLRVLNEDLVGKNLDKDKIIKLEQYKAVLTAELECKKQELAEKTKELNKERQKLENSIRHEQSLQSKQESLIVSLDQITQECENLRNQLNSIESDKDSFETQYSSIIKDVKHKEDKLKEYEKERQDLNKNIDDLKTNLTQLNIEIKKLKEKEMLLLQYPDLYGPIPIQKETDLIDDMESQMQANKHRINLLEAQNETLKVSIHRLINVNSAQQQQHSTPKQGNDVIVLTRQDAQSAMPRPIPLFKLEDEILEEISKRNEAQLWTQNGSIVQSNHKYQQLQQHQHHDVVYEDNIFIQTTTTDTNNQTNECVVSNGVNGLCLNGTNSSRRNSFSHSGSYRQNQHHSGRNTTPTSQISPPVKDMEVVIGKGHRPNSAASRPPSAASSTSNIKRPPSAASSKPVKKPQVDVKDKYYCERCYKNYSNRRDLDIHKLYCNK